MTRPQPRASGGGGRRPTAAVMAALLCRRRLTPRPSAPAALTGRRSSRIGGEGCQGWEVECLLGGWGGQCGSGRRRAAGVAGQPPAQPPTPLFPLNHLHPFSRTPTLAIVVPGSAVDNAGTAERGSALAGALARAAAVFCVDEVVVLDDGRRRGRGSGWAVRAGVWLDRRHARTRLPTRLWRVADPARRSRPQAAPPFIQPIHLPPHLLPHFPAGRPAAAPAPALAPPCLRAYCNIWRRRNTSESAKNPGGGGGLWGGVGWAGAGGAGGPGRGARVQPLPSKPVHPPLPHVHSNS